MAQKARYRAQAPGDGFGNVNLSEEELEDSQRLADEASAYADRFIAEENTTNFHIGVSNYVSNRALVYTIEASRLLCAASEPVALTLLEMAVEELKAEARITDR
jgi:hypothetical protein